MRQLLNVGLPLVLVVAAGSCADSPDGREARVSARRDLSSSDAVSIQFTAKNSGAHDVVLEFSWPIADVRVLELVNYAAATTGSDQAPAFDFAWQLLREGRVVSQRESPQRSTWVVDAATGGLGSGPLKSRGLAFGSFDLAAGEVYTLRVLPGPGFGAVVRAIPKIVVERASSITIGKS